MEYRRSRTSCSMWQQGNPYQEAAATMEKQEGAAYDLPEAQRHEAGERQSAIQHGGPCGSRRTQGRPTTWHEPSWMQHGRCTLWLLVAPLRGRKRNGQDKLSCPFRSSSQMLHARSNGLWLSLWVRCSLSPYR